MLAVLDLYPYFSKTSITLFTNTFFNDNIYLDKYQEKYYISSQNTDYSIYYLGKFTNPNYAYKVYRSVIIIMNLLGEFQLNPKYLEINTKELELLDKYIVYENHDKYKPFVDKSNYSTVCITFDGNTHYIQEYCNFKKVLLNTYYQDTNIINIKNNFIKRKEKDNFESVFWKTFHQYGKADLIDSMELKEAIENNNGFTTLEEIYKKRNDLKINNTCN